MGDHPCGIGLATSYISHCYSFLSFKINIKSYLEWFMVDFDKICSIFQFQISKLGISLQHCFKIFRKHGIVGDTSELKLTRQWTSPRGL